MDRDALRFYPVAMILLFEHMKGGMLEKHDRLAVPNAPIPDHLQRFIYRWFEALDVLALIRVSAARRQIPGRC